nr:MAG TPA: hypothetical protein [Caudoviricetes sp.]
MTGAGNTLQFNNLHPISLFFPTCSLHPLRWRRANLKQRGDLMEKLIQILNFLIGFITAVVVLKLSGIY